MSSLDSVLNVLGQRHDEDGIVIVAALAALDGNELHRRVAALVEALAVAAFTPAEKKAAQDFLVRTLPPLGQKIAASKAHGEAAAALGSVVLEWVVPVSVDAAVEAKNLGRTLLVTSQTAKARAAGCDLMRAAVAKWPGSESAIKMDPDR